MKTVFLLLFTASLLPLIKAQNTSCQIAESKVFAIAEKEVPLRQFYDGGAIISIFSNGANEFTFMTMAKDLEPSYNRINLKGRLAWGGEMMGLHNFLKLKDRTYLFLYNYQQKTKSEGISALEFFPDELEFSETPVDLFLSSKTIRIKAKYPTMNQLMRPTEQVALSRFSSSHGLFVSEDKTKFMCTYELVETDMKEGFEREKIGLYVFDQDLKKQWGGEYTMPYAKDRMESIDYVMGNDGKAYFLIRVHNKSLKKEEVNGVPDFHYEVAVYEKGEPAPEIIPLDLDRNFVKAHEFSESADHKIVFGGMVGNYPDKKMNGLFVIKINISNDSFGRVGKHYYNIPLATEHLYIPEGFLDGMRFEDKQEGHPFENMELRNMTLHPDGSMHIIIESYRTYLKSDHYNVTAEDVYVFRIGADGKQSWIRKIPKQQESNTSEGYTLSFNTIFTGDTVHLIYYDNKDNFNLKTNQLPEVFNGLQGSDLVSVRIGKAGEIEKYRCSLSGTASPDLGIRYFVPGADKTLMRLESSDHKGRLVLLRVE